MYFINESILGLNIAWKQRMERILIVDDEPLILFALKKALSNDFRDVTSVETAQKALFEIASRSYDLCLMDMYLPDGNGIEAMKEILRISPDTKIIIMTASSLDNNHQKSIESGALHFIPKPFHISEVRELVNHVLNNKRNVERTNLKDGIECSIDMKTEDGTKKVHNTFIAVDRSNEGMGIRTDFPLQPGNIIVINCGIEQRKGVVRWSKLTDDNISYRAGIKFV